MGIPLIDAHAHCGAKLKVDPVTKLPQPQAIEDYLGWGKGAGIVGAALMSPVQEVYNRLDPDFQDDAAWQQRRKESNEYVLSLAPAGFQVFPFFFIWNDFAVDQLSPRHLGVKWHRHDNEPHYHYDHPRCAAAIAEIRRRDLVVCLEEEWEYTWRFLTEWAPGVRVMIPHCGRLNGGYEQFASRGLWGKEHIFTDISNAPDDWVADYLAHFGHDRIMFGTDFPFAPSSAELRDRFDRLPLSAVARAAVAEGNLRRMVGK